MDMNRTVLIMLVCILLMVFLLVVRSGLFGGAS